jgi:hypothetical protein
VAGAFLALAGVAVALGGVLRKKACKKACLTRTRGTGLKESNTVGPATAQDRSEATTLDRHCLAVAVAALAPILALSLAYPEGGYEPFAPSAFWPALAGVVLVALLLPQGSLTPRCRRAVRVGAGLYALALVGAFAIHTPL